MPIHVDLPKAQAKNFVFSDLSKNRVPVLREYNQTLVFQQDNREGIAYFLEDDTLVRLTPDTRIHFGHNWTYKQLVSLFKAFYLNKSFNRT